MPNIACMSESKIDFRATEYTGASGVYAIRYYVNGQLSPDNHRSYCILDSLQVSSLCSDTIITRAGNESSQSLKFHYHNHGF